MLLRRGELLMICSLLVAASTNCCAQSAVVPEYSLKAAYLYHFIQFTDWPGDTIAGLKTFQICTAADSPLRAALSGLNGQAAHGKPISVRTNEPGHYEGCQVVLFSARDRETLDRATEDLVATNILTVSEDAGITKSRVIITFSVEERRVAFSINKKLAQLSGLQISSKLLRLARSVQ
jgi:hypothetical protein